MKIWTEQFGSGEDLVLIHGMGSASSAWNLIAPELSKHFRVTVLDLPGHGKTPFDPAQHMDATALGELVFKNLHDLGIHKSHLVGNSLGGWITLEMAAMNPDEVSSVTALAPAGLWLSPFLTRVPGQAMSKYMASGLKMVAPNLLKYEWARKIGFAFVSPKWRELSYETCRDATLAMGTAIGYFPAWDSLLKKRFDKPVDPTVPVTILFGDTDNTLPARTCQERSLAPAHTRWLVLPECGHAPMWDHPDEVIAEILATTGASQ